MPAGPYTAAQVVAIQADDIARLTSENERLHVVLEAAPRRHRRGRPMPRVTAAEGRAAMRAQGASEDHIACIYGAEAAPRAKRTVPTPETLVLRDVLRTLRHHPLVKRGSVHRMNSGATHEGNRFIRYGFPGCPDVLATHVDGRAIWVECKSAVGRLTPAQADFMALVQGPHQITIVARCAADVYTGGLAL